MIRTRPGRLCTDQFPELAPLADARPDELILDAELVCPDAAGRPDFARLRHRLVARTRAAVERAAAAAPATLMILDALWHEGQEVWRRSYDDRRAVLDTLALEGRKLAYAASVLRGARRPGRRHARPSTGGRRGQAPRCPI